MAEGYSLLGAEVGGHHDAKLGKVLVGNIFHQALVDFTAIQERVELDDVRLHGTGHRGRSSLFGRGAFLLLGVGGTGIILGARAFGGGKERGGHRSDGRGVWSTVTNGGANAGEDQIFENLRGHTAQIHVEDASGRHGTLQVVDFGWGVTLQ